MFETVLVKTSPVPLLVPLTVVGAAATVCQMELP